MKIESCTSCGKFVNIEKAKVLFTPDTHFTAEKHTYLCVSCERDALRAEVERLTTHMTKGGEGSHWDGCEETHYDCKIAKLEAEADVLKIQVGFLETAVKIQGDQTGEIERLRSERDEWQGLARTLELNLSAANDAVEQLHQALAPIIKIIDEGGAACIHAHASEVIAARKALRGEK